uniref:Uncharacterized protein n=1 Tax=Leersia perrieri TaxID=77586 RepID=A0A0D9WG24_9ORYZ
MSRKLQWLIALSLGWYGGWKSARHLSEVERLAEAAAPKPMAKLLKEYVFAGGVEARRAKQLDDSVQELTAELREFRRLSTTQQQQGSPPSS